jgi:hypothetical protein
MYTYFSDKELHFFAGALVYIYFSRKLYILPSLIVVLMTGIGKELVDCILPKGDPSGIDIAWTVLGGLTISLTILFKERYEEFFSKRSRI